MDITIENFLVRLGGMIRVIEDEMLILVVLRLLSGQRNSQTGVNAPYDGGECHCHDPE